MKTSYKNKSYRQFAIKLFRTIVFLNKNRWQPILRIFKIIYFNLLLNSLT